MARIHAIVERGRYRVSIQGMLTSRDLRRLEWACGPALEYERMPLDVLISDVTVLDEAAGRYLGYLATRGAIIVSG